MTNAQYIVRIDEHVTDPITYGPYNEYEAMGVRQKLVDEAVEAGHMTDHIQIERISDPFCS